jgi:hypothetical protein
MFAKAIVVQKCLIECCAGLQLRIRVALKLEPSGFKTGRACQEVYDSACGWYHEWYHRSACGWYGGGSARPSTGAEVGLLVLDGPTTDAVVCLLDTRLVPRRTCSFLDCNGGGPARSSKEWRRVCSSLDGCVGGLAHSSTARGAEAGLLLRQRGRGRAWVLGCGGGPARPSTGSDAGLIESS